MKTFLCFILLIFFSVNTYAQLKNEFGYTINISRTDFIDGKSELSGCLGCGTMDAVLTQKKQGLGLGAGVYDNILLTKATALNLDLNVNYIHASFLYTGNYRSSSYSPSSAYQIENSTEKYNGDFRFFTLSPGVGLLIYLNKYNQNKIRVYAKPGMALNILLKNSSVANIRDFDTINTVPASSTISTAIYNEKNIIKPGFTLQPYLGIGLQTPQNNRLLFHFELAYYRWIPAYVTTFTQTDLMEKLSVYNIVFKVGFSLNKPKI